MEYRKLAELPKEVLETFFKEHWNDTQMAIRGQLFHLLDSEGFVAMDNQNILGIITWQIIDKQFEILSLDSLKPREGIGSQLLALVEEKARLLGFRNCHLTTTNDNLVALSFYQKRGYHIARVFPNAVAKARQLKPSIPLISENGIPIRDELELIKPLN